MPETTLAFFVVTQIFLAPGGEEIARASPSIMDWATCQEMVELFDPAMQAVYNPPGKRIAAYASCFPTTEVVQRTLLDGAVARIEKYKREHGL